MELNAATRLVQTAAWFDDLSKESIKELIESVETQLKMPQRSKNKSAIAKLKQQLRELKQALKTAK